jgi:membrane protein DedA with SNARE-associated domain
MSLELVPLDLVQEIAHQYGYVSVLLGIMIENTGIPIPGETITLAAGFLAGNGELNYWGVLGSAITGAVIGDSLGYWVGAYGGWALMTRLGRFFRIQESQLEAVRDRFSKNAPQAVFLGRFIALLRIFAGPLAGIAKMPYSQFLLYNVSGAAVWAIVTVSAAYFIGSLVSLERLLGWMTQLGIAAFFLVVGAIALPILWENRHKLFKSLKRIGSQE